MVTSNDKWFNEIDGEQAFPSPRDRPRVGTSFCAGSRSVGMMAKVPGYRWFPGTCRTL